MPTKLFEISPRSIHAADTLADAVEAVAEWMALVNAERRAAFKQQKNIYTSVQPIEYIPDDDRVPYSDEHSVFDRDIFRYWEAGCKAIALNETTPESLFSTPEFSTNADDLHGPALEMLSQVTQSLLREDINGVNIRLKDGTDYEFTFDATEFETPTSVVNEIQSLPISTTYVRMKDDTLYYAVETERQSAPQSADDTLQQLQRQREQAQLYRYRRTAAKYLLTLLAENNYFTVPFAVGMKLRPAGRLSPVKGPFPPALQDEISSALDLRIYEQGDSLVMAQPAHTATVEQTLERLADASPADTVYKRKMGEMLGYPEASREAFATNSVHARKYWLSLAYKQANGETVGDVKYLQLCPYKPAPSNLQDAIRLGKQLDLALRQFAATYELDALANAVDREVNGFTERVDHLSAFN